MFDRIHSSSLLRDELAPSFEESMSNPNRIFPKKHHQRDEEVENSMLCVEASQFSNRRSSLLLPEETQAAKFLQAAIDQAELTSKQDEDSMVSAQPATISAIIAIPTITNIDSPLRCSDANLAEQISSVAEQISLCDSNLAEQISHVTTEASVTDCCASPPPVSALEMCSKTESRVPIDADTRDSAEFRSIGIQCAIPCDPSCQNPHEEGFRTPESSALSTTTQQHLLSCPPLLKAEWPDLPPPPSILVD